MDASARWASVNSASLARWREAVKASQAVQTLGNLLQTSTQTVRIALPNGAVVECPIDKSYIGYLLKAEELWARSYAQWIAAESRSPELLRQVEQERERPGDGIYYPTHWEETDFVPIQMEIETLFRALRWKQ